MASRPKKEVPSEQFLREQLEASIKDNRSLKQRIDALEKENQQLKKSVYDLSFRNPVTSNGRNAVTFDVDAALENPAGSTGPVSRSDVSVDSSTLTIPTLGSSRDGRMFYQKIELKGHSGAVYSIQFSPCGRFIGSGSFDKSVRVWDAAAPTELKRLDKHTLNVSDISWSRDSSLLLSGAYDQTCNIWDVDAGKHLTTHKAEGFVQCVMFNPTANETFFCGTTRKFLCMFDRRKPNEPFVMTNDAMVNSIYIFQDGTTVLTGDSNGYLKTWDVRTGKCLDKFLNEPTKKPISHVHIAVRSKEEEETRFMAVNSYDNVLRVYDRGTQSSTFAPVLLHSLKAHRNQNWPIKSAFFHGSEYIGSPLPRVNSSGYDDHDDSVATNEATLVKQAPVNKSVDQSLLLVTGSADAFAYLYDVGGREASGELVQRLEGHTDRVYATAFHPSKPLLATCSADFSLKVWTAKTKTPTIMPRTAEFLT